MMFNEIALTFLVGVVGGLLFLWRKAQRSSPHNTNKGVTPAAGAGATPTPAGTTTTSTTTSSRTWGWTNSGWGKVAIVLVVIAFILFGGPIFIWLANFDWATTPTGEVLEDNFGQGSSALMWVVVVVAIIFVVVTITGTWRKTTKQVSSISLISLLWVGVIGFVLIQMTFAINNWLNEPSTAGETHHIAFPRKYSTRDYALRQPGEIIAQVSVQMGPRDTLVTRNGSVQIVDGYPFDSQRGYHTCHTTSHLALAPLRERGEPIFSVTVIGFGVVEVRFTDAARAQLIGLEIKTVTVLIIKRQGGDVSQGEPHNPCQEEI